MTIEEKAKAYDEAIERAQNAADSGMVSQNFVDDIFQLRESEDERIRRKIIEILKILPGCYWYGQKEQDECLAFLEKQKETLKLTNSIPSNFASSAKLEDRWHKVADSFPDSTREVLCKDAISNFFIGRYYKGSDSWEVSMYDDADKSNEYNPPVVMWCDIPSEKQKEQNEEDEECTDFTIYHPLKNGKGKYECIPYSFYGSLTSFSEDKDLLDFLRTCFYTEEECNEWIEQQKEQKTAEQNTREQIISKATTERQVVLISESNDRAEINWDTRSLEDTKTLLECGLTFINKQLGIESSGWSENNKEMLKKTEQIILKHWNSLSDSFYHKYEDEEQDAESCYNWLKSLPERFNLQPKQEWSEEDKKHLQNCLSVIKMKLDEKPYPYYDDYLWLKSLKDKVIPQPKVEWSEQIKERIDEIAKYIKSKGYEDDAKFLESLYPQANTEWSEEDENMMEHIISDIESLKEQVYCKSLCDEELTWLKSLRPQSHWKPTKEQMDALYRSVEYLANYGQNDDDLILNSLYYDLKREMEE